MDQQWSQSPERKDIKSEKDKCASYTVHLRPGVHQMIDKCSSTVLLMKLLFSEVFLKKNRYVFTCILLFVLVTGRCGDQKAGKKYPARNIHIYIFSSQGGGSDSWARHLAALMEKQLGVHLICNNLPGANGGTGALKVWNESHDGYTLLGGSETSLFFGVNDVAPMAENWQFFVACGSPGVLAVHRDSPIKTFEQLVDAARANPNQFKVSNSGRGKLWHIKAVQTENAADIKLQHIPYNGSAPAITALLSREVDAVSCSAAEILEYVRGGLLRPLIMTEADGFVFDRGDSVRSVTELYPYNEQQFENLYQWLGFLVPHDVPRDRINVIGRAFEFAMNAPETEKLIRQNKCKKIAVWGDEANQLMLKMQNIASWMSKDLGLAKKDPSELGISRTL